MAERIQREDPTGHYPQEVYDHLPLEDRHRVAYYLTKMCADCETPAKKDATICENPSCDSRVFAPRFGARA